MQRRDRGHAVEAFAGELPRGGVSDKVLDVRVVLQARSRRLDHARREVRGEDSFTPLRQESGELACATPYLQGFSQALRQLPQQEGVVLGVVFPAAPFGEDRQPVEFLLAPFLCRRDLSCLL